MSIFVIADFYIIIKCVFKKTTYCKPNEHIEHIILMFHKLQVTEFLFYPVCMCVWEG